MRLFPSRRLAVILGLALTSTTLGIAVAQAQTSLTTTSGPTVSVSAFNGSNDTTIPTPVATVSNSFDASTLPQGQTVPPQNIMVP